jgi:capsular exopolysaccharide synthesis family protein
MNDLVLHDPNWPQPVGQAFITRESTSASMRYALGIARSKWKLALIAAMATAAIVFGGASLLLPKSEYAEATLVIQPLGQNLAQPDSAQPSLPPDTSAVDTQVEVLRSGAIAELVAKKLKLYQDPAFGGAPDAKPTDDAVMRRVVGAIQAGSRIRRIGLTYVIEVGYAAKTTAQAKRLANAIVDAYINLKMDEKLQAVTRANRDLGATLNTLRRRALETQSQVQDYEAQHHLLDVKGTSLTEAELSDLNQRIADAQADVAEKNSRLAVALGQARHGGGADLGATLASGTIGALRQKEADVSAQVSQLETEFRPDYPPLKKALAELSDIRGQLSSETRRIISSLKSDADAASQREASLLASRATAETKLETSNRDRVGLLTLEQAAATAKKIYETYLTQASEVTAARSLQQVDATVESRAISISGSALTSRKTLLALSLLLAAIAGLAAIAFSEIWSRGIRSGTDLRKSTGLPLAGVVPDISAWSGKGNPANHIAKHPLTACAEAYRNLCAFITLSLPPEQSKIVAVTSSVPGEGKSLTSVCLARTLAATGSRVVLLDCDVRRAGASKFFVKPRYGIAEIVKRSAPLDQALVHDAKSGVWFLSASAANDISGDFFVGKGIDELLRTLGQRFDRIVIDTSPLLGFADARILASKAGCVVHVVQWSKTPEATVRAAVEILRQCKANVVGAVLNKVDVRQQAHFGLSDGSDYFHYFSGAYAPRG